MFLLPLPLIITLLVINWPAAVVFLLTSVAGRRLRAGIYPFAAFS
jgi:hypothetical protein